MKVSSFGSSFKKLSLAKNLNLEDIYLKSREINNPTVLAILINMSKVFTTGLNTRSE